MYSTTLCTLEPHLSGHLNLRVPVPWSTMLNFWRGRKSSLPMLSVKALAPVAPSHNPTHLHRATTHTPRSFVFLPAWASVCCFTFSMCENTGSFTLSYYTFLTVQAFGITPFVPFPLHNSRLSIASLSRELAG